MKKIALSIILSTLFMNIFALDGYTKNLTTDEQNAQTTLLNYIEYSTVQMLTYKNKAVAEKEFDFVINKIKRDALIDESITTAYDQLLKTLTQIKLKDNERNFIKQMAEKERKQAFTKSLTSFGSVFVPGATPQQMIASLAYTGVSACFNYMSTVDSIDNTSAKDLFVIDQAMLENVDNQRRMFFSESTNLIRKYNLNEKYFIYENEMDSFVKTLKASPSERVKALDLQKNREKFRYFPPFWYELGSSYQSIDNFTKAKECYSVFESLKVNPVIKNDIYYVELAKNMIDLLAGSSSDYDKRILKMRENQDQIRHYIQIIDQETPQQTEAIADSNYYVAKILYLLGDTDKAVERLQWNLGVASVVPEFYDDSLSLLKVIKASSRDAFTTGSPTIDSLAFRYSQIPFGLNPNAVVFFGQYDKEKEIHVPFTPQQTVTRYFDFDQNNLSGFIDRDHIYFSLPSSILAQVTLSVEINGVLYIPKCYTPVNTKSNLSSLYFIEYRWNDLHANTPIVFHFDSTTSNSTLSIEYIVTPIGSDLLNDAEGALTRIGSDIAAKDAMAVAVFANKISRYKYQVKDIDAERRKIQKDVEKELDVKKHPDSDPQPLISSRMQTALGKDSQEIKKIWTTTELDLRKKSPLYESHLYQFTDQKWLVVGIHSITVETGNDVKKYTFTNGEPNAAQIPQISAKRASDDQFDKLIKKAALGDTDCQFEVGRRYYEGIGVPVNYAIAIKWLYKAASQNHGEACKYMGFCYRNGNGVVKNTQISKEWFLKAKSRNVQIDKSLIN